MSSHFLKMMNDELAPRYNIYNFTIIQLIQRRHYCCPRKIPSTYTLHAPLDKARGEVNLIKPEVYLEFWRMPKHFRAFLRI